jgi:hypothetical protein
VNQLREKDSEEIADDFQHLAYLALRDEVGKEDALCPGDPAGLILERIGGERCET